jgi:hypothetical protein
MKQISFSQKNSFIIRKKDSSHFSRDLELFKKHFPAHDLNTELARANRFSYGNLDGQMLYFLLDEVSPEKILENRKEQPAEQSSDAIIGSIEQAKAVLISMEIDPAKVSDEFLATTIGRTLDSFVELFNTLKKELVGDAKILTLSYVPPSDGGADPNPADENPPTDEGSDPNPQENTGSDGQKLEKAETGSDETDESILEKVAELSGRIDELESGNEYNEDEISSLRSDLDDRDASIEDLTAKIEALEKKAFNKKKASSTSSPE